MGLEVVAIASVAASLAGAGMSAYGQYQQGKSAQAMTKHNAKIASTAASNEAQTAQQNSIRQREASRRQLSNIRARMAGSGVQQSTGSSLDVLGESASELELQALDLFRDSDAKQRMFGNEAAMTTWQGDQAAQAGKTAALGSLISGAGSFASNYSSSRSSGLIRTGNR
jgi:hypothetical protein